MARVYTDEEIKKIVNRLLDNDNIDNVSSYLKKLYGSLGGDHYYIGPDARAICDRLGLEEVPSIEDAGRMHSVVTTMIIDEG